MLEWGAIAFSTGKGYHRTIRGPAQALVSTAVGPAHKQPTVRVTLSEPLQPTAVRQSGGCQAERKVRGGGKREKGKGRGLPQLFQNKEVLSVINTCQES